MNISKSLNAHIDGFAEGFASSFYAFKPFFKRETPTHLKDAEFLAYEQETESLFQRELQAHEDAKNAIRELVARDAKESWVAPEKFAPKKPFSMGRFFGDIFGLNVKEDSTVYTPEGLSHVHYRVNPSFTLAIDEHDPFSPVLLITRGATLLTSPVFSVKAYKPKNKFAKKTPEDELVPGSTEVGGVYNRGLAGEAYSSICLQPISEKLRDMHVLVVCQIYENAKPYKRFTFDIAPSNRKAAAEEIKVMNAFLGAQARKLVRALYAVSKVLGPVPGSEKPFPPFNPRDLYWTCKATNPDPTRYITHLVYRENEDRWSTGEPAIRVIED